MRHLGPVVMRLLTFPEPRHHLTRRPTSKGKARLYWDRSTVVLRWMTRNAFRRIHAFSAEAVRLPTLDELEAWIGSSCERARDEFSEKKFSKLVEDAAIFALSNYDAETYEKARERGANGGRLSGRKKGHRGQRPPAYTPDMLDGLEHMSKAEQSAHLGCSTATIARLRRQRVEAVEETLEDLLALPVAEVIETPAVAPLEPPEHRPGAPIISILTGEPISSHEEYIDHARARMESRLQALAPTAWLIEGIAL